MNCDFKKQNCVWKKCDEWSQFIQTKAFMHYAIFMDPIKTAICCIWMNYLWSELSRNTYCFSFTKFIIKLNIVKSLTWNVRLLGQCWILRFKTIFNIHSMFVHFNWKYWNSKSNTQLKKLMKSNYWICCGVCKRNNPSENHTVELIIVDFLATARIVNGTTFNFRFCEKCDVHFKCIRSNKDEKNFYTVY